MPDIGFGNPYFQINLKSVQAKQQGMGEGEFQLSPEMISYNQMPPELQPYLGQEEMAGRYNRPAITSGGAGNQPALSGGGGGTQGKTAMDYLSQLVGPAKGLMNRAITGISVPSVPLGSSGMTPSEMASAGIPMTSGYFPGENLGQGYAEIGWPGETGGWQSRPEGLPEVGGTSGWGQAIGGGIGALTGAVSQNPAMGYIGQTAGQVAGSMLGGQPLNLGTSFAGGLQAGMAGQSDWTNPYSGYAESIIGSILPGLGTPLAGIIEGIFGKGGTGPKENPQYTQTREMGMNRAKQLKDQGMTPYQIWQWANENGYAVNVGTQEPGTEGTGDVYTVYNPQEAMMIDQIESGMLGTQPQRPMQSDQGWYWGGEGQWSGWTPGSEWKVPEYHKSLEELLGKKSFTKAMSNIYEGDEGYLIGSSEKKEYVNPWQY